MQRFQFYVPEGVGVPDLDQVAEACVGAAWEDDGAYRPGTWRDAATGAVAVLDLGEPPIEPDLMHPPRQYAGWTPVPLSVQVRLTGPHWQAVECLAWIEGVVARLPGVSALDVEDIQATPDAEPGPFAWSRPRALASWLRQRDEQVRSRTDLARMERGRSLLLWRYRRERAAAQARHPDLCWPDTHVLRDRHDGTAVAACLWEDPRRDLALPPVAVVAVMHGDKPRVLPAQALPAGSDLGIAVRLAAAALADPGLAAAQLPGDRFVVLEDADWID
jgi:hypothetical protein